MFELTSIHIKSNTYVEYGYKCNEQYNKLFSKKTFYVKYDIDISSVPHSILVIPLLSNILPISWFAGFDIKMKELDSVFYHQALKLKKQFSEYYPVINQKESNLIVEELVENKAVLNNKTAMLFSGGVDAYTTLLRHYEEVPDLITIKGADIAIDDKEQWDSVMEYINTTPTLQHNRKYTIESNLREFINFNVDALLPSYGWWGRIQHGLALTCLTAPLAYLNGYETVLIASTRSSKMPFSPWGSMPETDNLVKFSSASILHDGYELTRLDKVRTILELSSKYNTFPPLRVCYHDIKEALNCNKCEKCCRTIFAIMICGRNPNVYGFKVDDAFYEIVKSHFKNGFRSEGVKFYWAEMLENYNDKIFYYIENSEKESEEIKELKALNTIAQDIGVVAKGGGQNYVLKQKIIRNFPKTFRLYLKIRRKLS